MREFLVTFWVMYFLFYPTIGYLIQYILFCCFFSFIIWQYHQTAVVPRTSILATEVEWLNSIKADLVVLQVFFFT